MFKSDYMDDSFFKAVTSLYDSPKGNSDRANSHIGNSRYLKKQILTDSQRFRATTANFFKDKPYAKPKLILISDYELDPLQFETQATSKKESRKLSKKDYTIEQSI